MRLLLDKRSSNGRRRRTNNGYSKSQVLLEESKRTLKQQPHEVCMVCLYTIHHNVGTRTEDLVDNF
jgi:hypothetical protein